MPAPARKRDSKASRRSIMEAARQLLALGGGDLAMAWVARAAGVSQGLAYHHFGSKEGLLNALGIGMIVILGIRMLFGLVRQYLLAYLVRRS